MILIPRFNNNAKTRMGVPPELCRESAKLANCPFGSGFGTFVPVYEKFAPRTLLGGYANHAHDDGLELWLAGVLAVMLAIGFLA